MSSLNKEEIRLISDLESALIELDMYYETKRIPDLSDKQKILNKILTALPKNKVEEGDRLYLQQAISALSKIEKPTNNINTSLKLLSDIKKQRIELDFNELKKIESVKKTLDTLNSFYNFYNEQVRKKKMNVPHPVYVLSIMKKKKNLIISIKNIINEIRRIRNVK